MNNYYNKNYYKLNMEELANIDKVFNKVLEKYLQFEESQKEYTKEDIDQMLDEHNDYLLLYNMFGDVEYKDHAESIMQVLKSI